MATTKNIQQDPFNSDDEEKLLLDEFILILNSNGHATNTYGDMLIYVHEKPNCYNIREKGTGAKCASYKKGLRQN